MNACQWEWLPPKIPNRVTFLFLYLPFAIGWNIIRTFLSCGFVYYLINAIIAFVGIVAHTCCLAVPVSRERDEPDNIYRYAEEFYANTQDESSYGYDNEDDSTLSIITKIEITQSIHVHIIIITRWTIKLMPLPNITIFEHCLWFS